MGKRKGLHNLPGYRDHFPKLTHEENKALDRFRWHKTWEARTAAQEEAARGCVKKNLMIDTGELGPPPHHGPIFKLTNKGSQLLVLKIASKNGQKQIPAKHAVVVANRMQHAR